MNMLRTRQGMAINHPLVLFIVGFFGVGFIGAIFVVVLGALYSSVQPTADGGANFSGQEIITQNVINNTIDLFSNFTGQFGTVGTVGGVLVLLVLLAAVGIGGYAAYKKYRD